MALLLTLILVGGPLAARADTLVDVRPGDRLVLADFRGDLSVEVWDRPRMNASGVSVPLSVSFINDKKIPGFWFAW